MLNLKTSNQFNEDVRRLRRQGYELDELWAIVRALEHEEDIDLAAFDDHALEAEWGGARDLHIRDDWLLIYRINGQDLELLRTGTHDDVFRGWR